MVLRGATEATAVAVITTDNGKSTTTMTMTMRPMDDGGGGDDVDRRKVGRKIIILWEEGRWIGRYLRAVCEYVVSGR